MTSDEIRERFLEFFAAREHLRLPSASLVPAASDTSALLTVAGMHPLKPYFLGVERPPAPRLASCQKVFRTVDLDVVGTTARHLTFFEMLGNFSIGDYFKREAVALRVGALNATATASRRSRSGSPSSRATTRSASASTRRRSRRGRRSGCRASGSSPARAARTSGRPARPGRAVPARSSTSTAGLAFGRADDLPGQENARFLEFWNLVFMQYDQQPPDTLTPLPARNIDTGLGLNRMAAILQGVPIGLRDRSVPAADRAGRAASGGAATARTRRVDRSLRILADHARGMTFLVADGVVPSNEDRGYVLRRVMRRAIQHGRALGFQPGFLVRYGELVREVMGAAYPELHEQREAIDVWLASEEESFGRTLEQGLAVLRELIERARDGARRRSAVPMRSACTTRSASRSSSRASSRGGGARGRRRRVRGADGRSAPAQPRRRRRRRTARRTAASARARSPARAGFATRFTGYETTEQATTVGAVERENGRVLVKLADSPFYAAGGGQVSDVGTIECADGDCVARVAEVVRVGEDQALWAVLEEGELHDGERVIARVDRLTRHATECNHTATHLLHAALRGAWAATSARPAPTSAPTSCASTSATARR